MDRTFYLSSSPHVHDGDSTSRIMWSVSAALVPSLLWSVYVFGFRALCVTAISILAAALAEGVALRLRGRPAAVLADGSAVLTGLLLALNLPVSAPWWLAAIGGALAILLGKQVFGGLGHNLFNPALVARVFLLVSFPVQMTDWAVNAGALADAVTGATPLGAAKAFLLTPNLASLPDLPLWQLFVGMRPGCLGEISPLFLLLGAGYLFYRRILTADIPVGFALGLVAVTGAAWLAHPERYLDPATHLLTGGFVLGAFFMATDMVTSPLTTKGRWIFGLGCGLITGIIRLWGGYPEGVSFSILLMNACVPLIERYTRPRKFGFAAPAKEGAR